MSKTPEFGWLDAIFFRKKNLEGSEEMTPSTVVPEVNIPITVHLPENPKHWNSLQDNGRSYLEDAGSRTSMRKTLASMVGLEGLVVEVSHQH